MHTPRFSAFHAFMLALLITAALAAPTAHAQDEDTEGSVAVAGLRVVVPPPDDQQELRAFNWFPGTTVALRFDYPDGGLIEIDPDASALDHFTDDQGTNLLEGGEAFRQSGIGRDATIGPDQKAALIEVTGPSVPAAGARSLRLKGVLAFRVAYRQQAYKAENVSLARGERVEAGPTPFTVREVGEPKWGDAAVSVALQTDRDVASVAEIRFYDADGNRIEADRAGTMRTSFGDAGTTQISYNLARDVETADIEIVHWAEMKTIKQAFDREVSVGLGE